MTAKEAKVLADGAAKRLDSVDHSVAVLEMVHKEAKVGRYHVVVADFMMTTATIAKLRLAGYKVSLDDGQWYVSWDVKA